MTFLLNSSVYGIDLPNKTHLRVPVGQNSTYSRIFNAMAKNNSAIPAHFPMRSMNNSFSIEGASPTILKFKSYVNGKLKEFSAENAQEIQYLGSITSKRVEHIKLTFLGSSNSKFKNDVLEYLKPKHGIDILGDAITDSLKLCSEFPIHGKITIVLADKYDYFAGNNKRDHVIILNASDIKEMLKNNEGPAFIKELITRALSKEFAHERGADNTEAADMKLAADCAMATIERLRKVNKPVSEYIDFLNRYSKENEKYLGYPSFIVELENLNNGKRDSVSARGLRKLFYDKLDIGLIREGFSTEYAGLIANTIVSLTKEKIKLLEDREKEDGAILSMANISAIKTLNPNFLNIKQLANKIRKEISEYEKNGLSLEQIKAVISTNIMPWKDIQKFKRKYMLKDVSLIILALKRGADPDGFLKTKLSSANKTGTLDKKNLHIYEPIGTPKDRQKTGMQLFENLNSIATILEEALIRPDNKKEPLVCKISEASKGSGLFKNLVLMSNRPVDDHYLPKGSHVVLIKKDGLRIYGYTVDQIRETNVTLSKNGQADDFSEVDSVDLLPCFTDIPTRIQLDIVKIIMKNLKKSNYTTTGNPVYDKIFGLKQLSISANNPINLKELKDKNIAKDEAQKKAVELAMNDTEVLFIQGPAGTGKTTVIAEVAIAEIIRQAVKSGKKILLVSQMHRAVDQCLLKFLNDQETPILRLANLSNGDSKDIDDKVRDEFWLGDIGSPQIQNIEKFISRKRFTKGGYLIAATNMGSYTDSLFHNDMLRNQLGLGNKEEFDLVIMDECSRSGGVEALVPLQQLSEDGKVIFVGDEKQLPPYGLSIENIIYLIKRSVSKNDIAAYMMSILDLLQQKDINGDKVMLSTNYRSHPLITGLISILFYDGYLNPRGWEDYDRDTFRIVDIKNPKKASDNKADINKNNASAEEIVKLVRHYHNKKGVRLEDITIITPYKEQVRLIMGKMRKLKKEMEASGQEKSIALPKVTTIDSYQGGENSVIIFDFVRSNEDKKIGFIKDPRRLNVALSRAKDMLAIVWDSSNFIEGPGSFDTGEDRIARELFKKTQDYYDKNVSSVFSEEEEPDEAVIAEEEKKEALEEDSIESINLTSYGIKIDRKFQEGQFILEPEENSGRSYYEKGATRVIFNRDIDSASVITPMLNGGYEEEVLEGSIIVQEEGFARDLIFTKGSKITHDPYGRIAHATDYEKSIFVKLMPNGDRQVTIVENNIPETITESPNLDLEMPDIGLDQVLDSIKATSTQN